MRKNRNNQYESKKLENMRRHEKASRSVPLTSLTPEQVALKIKAMLAGKDGAA